MSIWDDIRNDLRGSPMLKVGAVILGGMAAFLITLFDAVFLRFGDDLGARAALVFLISWLLVTLMFFGWMLELKHGGRRAGALRETPQPVTKRQMILWLALVVLAVIMFLFRNVTLISFG